MAAKTVFRRLVGKYGIMSIDYHRQGDPDVLQAADDVAAGKFDELPDAAVTDPEATIE